MLEKSATGAPGDGPYFSAWHQSSTRLKLRLPFSPGRVQSARSTKFFFFFHGVWKHCNVSNVLCNSTNEGAGPKRLEKISTPDTPLFVHYFSFFVEHSLTYFLKCHAVYRNFFRYLHEKSCRLRWITFFPTQVFSENGSIICYFWRHRFNMLNSSWLWWIMRVNLANQKRRKILNK